MNNIKTLFVSWKIFLSFTMMKTTFFKNNKEPPKKLDRKEEAKRNNNRWMVIRDVAVSVSNIVF